MNLKEKPTRGQWEALWESLAPYCFCRHDFKRLREGEGASEESGVMERKRHGERKRLDILSKGRQKNRQKVRQREKCCLNYCCQGRGGQTLCI